jgi:hypothetical protein
VGWGSVQVASGDVNVLSRVPMRMYRSDAVFVDTLLSCGIRVGRHGRCVHVVLPSLWRLEKPGQMRESIAD